MRGATENRTLDKAGKVTARDTNNDSAADYTPTYNDANMLTADGRHYTYTYDMLGRVVTAKDSTATTTIKEYKWDPGCTLLAWREDVSVPADGLDGSDAWYYSVASAEGQAKATIRGSDTDAKELYTYHAAGIGGRSGDKRVIVRDVHGNGHMAGYGNGGTDAAKWGDAATGTFTHRYYPLYDAEGNLTHVKTSAGMTVERWQHNRANRVPTQLFVTDVADDAGNTGANGGTNEGDYNAFFAADGYFNGASVKTDFDQDGDADAADYNRFMDTFFEAPAQGRAAGSVFKMVYLAAGQMYDDTLSGPTDPATMTLTARSRWVICSDVPITWYDCPDGWYYDPTLNACRQIPAGFYGYLAYCKKHYKEMWQRLINGGDCREIETDEYLREIKHKPDVFWIEKAKLVGPYQCRELAISVANNQCHESDPGTNVRRHCAWTCCLDLHLGGNRDRLMGVLERHECCTFMSIALNPQKYWTNAINPFDLYFKDTSVDWRANSLGMACANKIRSGKARSCEDCCPSCKDPVPQFWDRHPIPLRY